MVLVLVSPNVSYRDYSTFAVAAPSASGGHRICCGANGPVAMCDGGRTDLCGNERALCILSAR